MECMIRRYFFGFLILQLLSSCRENKQQQISDLVEEWSNKEILFPSKLQFTSLEKKSPSLLDREWDYAIVSYTDSMGCISCKLKLDKWKEFINQKDSIFKKKVEVLLFLHPSEIKETLLLLKGSRFDYPVCIDHNDAFNKLNNLPTDIAFHTFLIDKQNKVLAIGNPIQNHKIEELYLKIIRNDDVEDYENKQDVKTIVNIDKNIFFIGSFDWHKEQRASFILKNNGNNPLVIEDVSTSCGCTSVDYSKQPVRSGDSISLTVVYKAEHPEHFDKTINVYCNTSDSPIRFRITGDAK